MSELSFGALFAIVSFASYKFIRERLLQLYREGVVVLQVLVQGVFARRSIYVLACLMPWLVITLLWCGDK